MSRTQPSPLAERIGQRIRQRRKSLGLSMQKVCDRIERTKAFMSQLENGTSEPGAATLLRICRALGMSADELLGVNEVEG